MWYNVAKEVMHMQPYMMAYFWIALAVVLVLVEVASVQLVSVWFVLGAVCAAVTSIFTDSLVIQIVVFVSVSLAALVITRPLVKKFKTNRKKLNTNVDRLIDQTGVMLSDLTDPQAVGQAKVLGKVWSVKSDVMPLKKGDTVRVLAVEGVKLIVRKVQ